MDATATAITVQGNRVGTDATAYPPGSETAGPAWGQRRTGRRRRRHRPGQGNLVSGNQANGIVLSSATGNSILDNTIGTNVFGTNVAANLGDSILLSSSLDNTISGNLISGNTANGVELTTLGGQRHSAGNEIGVKADGVSLMGNGGDGVFVQNIQRQHDRRHDGRHGEHDRRQRLRGRDRQ